MFREANLTVNNYSIVPNSFFSQCLDVNLENVKLSRLPKLSIFTIFGGSGGVNLKNDQLFHLVCSKFALFQCLVGLYFSNVYTGGGGEFEKNVELFHSAKFVQFFNGYCPGGGPFKK